LDALRRIRPRIAAGRSPRRVSTGDLDQQMLRLRGADRRLAQALDQLRSGVPLNWGQVEDDPEMATLGRLQQAGQECRLLPLSEPSPEMKASLIKELSAKLPEPVVKPQKVAPKTLAGFSEHVQVPTQVEDDIKLGVNWPLTLLRGGLGLALIVLVIWGIGSFLKAGTIPTYEWIEALQNKKPVTRVQNVLSVGDLPCKVTRSENPLQPSYFAPVQLLRDAQSYVDYNIPLLPAAISVPPTYTFQLSFINVSPCEGSTLKPSDTGALVMLAYRSVRQQTGPTATARLSSQNTRTNIPGQSAGGQSTSAFLSLFASNEQPAYIDVSTGSWHEVHDGDVHGLYWRGGPYQDPSGAQWMGDISVLLLEHGDTVVTLVGPITDGFTEDVLVEAGRHIAW
jgi:hypothetical protein